ncbi:MAG: HEAT repeat domain-containing protein, partial [Burkholderiales bacterium]|nr:HEAT repeat domain-containing protein [Anaerolineae bacterium]
ITADPCVGRPDLWLLAAQVHPSARYRQPLCDMLVMPDECIWHEGIIEVFVLTKDADAVACLEQAITHNVNGAAVQAIAALAEIGTREAIQVIKNCLDSPHEAIREKAKLMLEILQSPS